MELLMFYGVANSSNISQRFYFLPIPARKCFKYAVFLTKFAGIGKKWYKMRILL